MTKNFNDEQIYKRPVQWLLPYINTNRSMTVSYQINYDTAGMPTDSEAIVGTSKGAVKITFGIDRKKNDLYVSQTEWRVKESEQSTFDSIDDDFDKTLVAKGYTDALVNLLRQMARV
jgi:hypothetical protein